MDTDAVIQAILIGLPATILGLLAYRRSRKVDAVAEQAGVAIEARAGTAQIIEGLNALVDNLQTDNKVFRDDFKFFTERLNECFAEREKLRQEVARLRKKYGEVD